MRVWVLLRITRGCPKFVTKYFLKRIIANLMASCNNRIEGGNQMHNYFPHKPINLHTGIYILLLSPCQGVGIVSDFY